MLAANSVLQGRYQIVRAIGQGGMGAVYEAKDLRLGHTVAVKELLLHDPHLQQAFEEEARRLAPLRHPALPNVSDHFTEDQGQYLVMEYISGNDLGELIKRRGHPFEAKWIIKWADQLLGALDYLHTRQPAIIHRDIKPSNLKLTLEGNIILLDFGLSKGGQLGTALQTRHSPASLYGYTLHYAPLEQIRATGTDERSDLYALAATLYHLAASKPPDVLERAAEMSSGNPDPLRPIRHFNAQMPPAVDDLIMQALKLNQNERPASAKDMRHALQKATQPVVPPAPTVREPVKPASQPAKPASQPVRRARPASQPVRRARPTSQPARAASQPARRARTTSQPAHRAEPTRQPVSPARQPVSAKQTKPWLMQAFAIALVVGVLLFVAVGISILSGGSSRPEAAEAPTEPSAPFSSHTRTKDDMTMVYVPDGSFQMGSDDRDSLAESDEKPLHQVTLSAFWIDQTEVTNEQFAAFLNERGNQEEGGSTWLEADSSDVLIERQSSNFQPKEGFADHPVIMVSWYGAKAYCEWAGRRLPSEAEWEYAARGREGRIYPWGNEFDGSRANCGQISCSDRFERTVPVGTFPAGASWVGALDMAGNVWEWNNDWYDREYYATSPEENPNGPDSGVTRVMHGGSWNSSLASHLRGAYRNFGRPSTRYRDVGFRCVVEVGG